MLKRKRIATPSDDDVAPTQNLQILKFKVFRKLAQGKRALSRAVKQSKRPENQRIHKRIVRAKEEKEFEKVEKLQRELEALKIIDASVAAEIHIRKTISRAKDLAASPVFLRYLSAEAPPVGSDGSTQDGMLVARNNVTARLYNAKIVKREVTLLLRNVRRALDIPMGDDDREEFNKAMAARKGREGQAEESREDDISVSGGSFWVGSEAELQEIDRSKTKPTKEKSEHDKRKLSSGKRNAAGASSHSDLENDHLQLPSKIANGTGIALSDSESDVAVPTPPKGRSTGRKTRASERDGKGDGKKTTSANSTFLPTLMAGGYWSGSESAEDLEELQPRKNRRGQRARQAIWELKYGRNANHLKSDTRGGDRDSRRDARDQNGAGRQQRGIGPRAAPRGGIQSPRDYATGPNAVVMSRSEAADKPEKERPLHPSWEAARQAKAQKQAASFTGKKIVFD
ncbi:MAG: hypothetical protein M1823_004327 [Watsoniomyces obsoletus]|nr:MAG: hypothetical protein M1823_004327 [Watsoniomyces obsoletus]